MTNTELTINFLSRIVKDRTGLFDTELDLGIEDKQIQANLIDTLFSPDVSNYQLGLILAKQQNAKLQQPIFRLLKSAHQPHKDREFGAATMTRHGKIEVRITRRPDAINAMLNLSGKNCGYLLIRNGIVQAYRCGNLMQKILFGQ